jgi:hypothetical protein
LAEKVPNWVIPPLDVAKNFSSKEEAYVGDYRCSAFAYVVAGLFRLSRNRGIHSHFVGLGGYFHSLPPRGRALSNCVSVAN